MTATFGRETAERVRARRAGFALITAAAMAALLFPAGVAHAATEGAAMSLDVPALTLDTPASAAPVPPSRIHGYTDMKILSAHLTPRGVMTVDKGVVAQPSAGLTIDLLDLDGPISNVSFITTAWTDLNSSHPGTGAWEEFDYSAGFGVTFLKHFTANANWMVWVFPDGAADTMYNTDLKLVFNDEYLLQQFALRPYVDLFWNYAGASPVVFGTAHTMYAEFGIEPHYVLHLGDYPITFKFPTYASVGDSSFWGNGDGHTPTSNLGVFSTGVRATMPLNCVPAGYGQWSAYVGGQYIHTCNPSLTYANEVIGSGSTHERFVGFGGVMLTF